MDEGVGVATGADCEPVQPAMLTALMSRSIIITADFNDIVPQLLSEAIIIVIHTSTRRSPVVDIPKFRRPAGRICQSPSTVP
jgi:hypothetical protein